MKIGEYEFQDDCPDDYELRCDIDSLLAGGLCMRCPIFCCTGKSKLIDPEDYRLDWAEEWHKFFMCGDLPQLKLNFDKNNKKPKEEKKKKKRPNKETVENSICDCGKKAIEYFAGKFLCAGCLNPECEELKLEDYVYKSSIMSKLQDESNG